MSLKTTSPTVISLYSTELDDNENNTTLRIPAPAAGLSLPQRIQYYHRLSREAGRVSIMAALAAGVELQRAKEQVEHGMFTNWIKSNCGFTARTAQNYMKLAESLLPEGAVAGLLEEPEEARQELLAQAAGEADARTLTELYAELGIVRPYKSNMGGARPGAGRPRTSGTDGRMRQIEDARRFWMMSVDKLLLNCRNMKTHLVLDVDTLDMLLVQLETVRDELKAARGGAQ